MVDVFAARRRSSPGPSLCRVFWAVFAGERRLTRPLTLGLEGGKEALAVFSHQEEAEMFLLSLGLAGEGCHVRRTSAGEVDPLPQMLADGFRGLVTLDRQRFVGWATGRERGPMLPDAG